MKIITITYLFVFMCLSFCACNSAKETHEASSNPTSNTHTENTKENNTKDQNSVQPEVSKEPEDLNEFELLEPNYDLTLKLDSIFRVRLDQHRISYKIEETEYTLKNHKGVLLVKYPQLIGTGKNLKKVNALIYEMVDRHVLKEEEINKGVDCEINYEIKKASDDIISIFFYGDYRFRPSGSSKNILFTFNYDLKGDKMIELNQVINIDTEFLKKFKGALVKGELKEVYDRMVKANSKLFTMISNLKAEDALFFFEENQIYISYMFNDAIYYGSTVAFYYY